MMYKHCILYIGTFRSASTSGWCFELREEKKVEWYLHGHPPISSELGLWATIHEEVPAILSVVVVLLPSEIDGKLEIEIAYLLAKEFCT